MASNLSNLFRQRKGKLSEEEYTIKIKDSFACLRTTAVLTLKLKEKGNCEKWFKMIQFPSAKHSFTAKLYNFKEINSI